MEAKWLSWLGEGEGLTWSFFFYHACPLPLLTPGPCIIWAVPDNPKIRMKDSYFKWEEYTT